MLFWEKELRDPAIREKLEGRGREDTMLPHTPTTQQKNDGNADKPRPNASGGGKGSFCTRCRKPGHTVADCWYMAGYNQPPSGWNGAAIKKKAGKQKRDGGKGNGQKGNKGKDDRRQASSSSWQRWS